MEKISIHILVVFLIISLVSCTNRMEESNKSNIVFAKYFDPFSFKEGGISDSGKIQLPYYKFMKDSTGRIVKMTLYFEREQPSDEKVTYKKGQSIISYRTAPGKYENLEVAQYQICTKDVVVRLHNFYFGDGKKQTNSISYFYGNNMKALYFKPGSFYINPDSVKLAEIKPDTSVLAFFITEKYTQTNDTIRVEQVRDSIFSKQSSVKYYSTKNYDNFWLFGGFDFGE